MYDAAKMANFGRDVARSYHSLERSRNKLCEEINDAVLIEGVKPIKITHDVMGRCPDQESAVNLMSCLIAMARMGAIPQSIVEPFEEGVRPKRV